MEEWRTEKQKVKAMLELIRIFIDDKIKEYEDEFEEDEETT